MHEDTARAPHEPTAERLREHAVDVWRVDLDRGGVDFGGIDRDRGGDDLLELLCPAERERAARIADERERRRWIRSRGVLRTLLGSYTQSNPRTVRLQQGTNGKLALDAGPSFNLSHSGGIAVYAFTLSAPVGVDVEMIDMTRRRDDVALAARTLGRTTAQRLATLDPATRRREFLREWVRYEARLKCLGTGLTGTDAEESPGEDRRTMWIAELDVGTEACAAVAVEGASREIRYWELESP
jgi:hypothetical protein